MKYFKINQKIINKIIIAISVSVACGLCQSCSPSTSISTPTSATMIPTSLTEISTPVITALPTFKPALPFYTINFKNKEGIGYYLVDSQGMALYYTTSDREFWSNLPDETLSMWPVFYVSEFVIPAALNILDFGTYIRDNGARQTTYKGYPLYRFGQDKNPGDTFGDRAGGVWFVMRPKF